MSGWRLWLVQASWNREVMQGAGLAAAAVPWLRRRSASDQRRWLEENLAYANTNPYLSGVLVGSSLKVEEQRGSETARRFFTALSHNLGALGDRFFWGAAQPLFAFLAGAAGLIAGPIAVVPIWLVFAGGQAWVRERGMRWGYARGENVIDGLAHPRVQTVIESTQLGAALALGLLAGLVAARAATALATSVVATTTVVWIAVLATVAWGWLWSRRGGWLARGVWIAVGLSWLALRQIG